MVNKVIPLIGELGRFTLDRIARTGRIFLFLCSAFAWAFRTPMRFHVIVEHMRSIVPFHSTAKKSFFTKLVNLRVLEIVTFAGLSKYRQVTVGIYVA